MTKSSTPSTLESTGDTNASTATEVSEQKKSRPIKPLLFATAGVVASVATVVVYRKLNRPVPKSEQIARKVRKYVHYLEKHDFEFPELPPHLRKTVTKKSHAVAKAGKKLSVKAAKAVKSQWNEHRAAVRKAARA